MRAALMGVLIAVAAGAGPAHGASGSIRGRVDVQIAPPPVERRPDVGALAMSDARDAAERRRSVVYLESAPRAAFDARDEPHAQMDQRNEAFVPHVLAIVAGTTVDFPNDDRTYHNVFSLSKTRSFNLGRYATGHSKSIRFDRPGIVRVFCDIHSHMSAFILVFAHRYFAVTDEEGRYHLDGVPAGTYMLTVWNEMIRGDAPRRAVTVPEGGGDVDADFVDPMKAFASLTNRIFLATAFLAVLSIGAAVYIVNKGVTRQAEGELERGLQESGTLVDEYRTVLFDHFRREARLIADLPVLKAAAFETSVETSVRLRRATRNRSTRTSSSITDRRGVVLVHFAPAGVPTAALARLPTVPARPSRPGDGGVLARAARHHPARVGAHVGRPDGGGSARHAEPGRQRSTIGSAAKFKSLTASDLAFGVNGAIQSSTLPADRWPALALLLNRPGVTSRLQLGSDEYIVMTRPLLPDSGPRPTAPSSCSGRVTERLRFLGTLHTLLGVTAVLAVLPRSS